MANKFAYPLADSTFKMIFGQDKHKQLTINFLNAFLERTGDRAISQIEFMSQEKNPRRLGDRKSILDIHCKDQAGNRFIIEMQKEKEFFFDLRALYYASGLLSRQLEETEPYNKLTPVIVIGILDFVLYKSNSDQVISHHMICDMSTKKQSINLIELHFIELSKFNKKLDELTCDIEKWIFFFKYAQKFDVIPSVYQDSPSIQQAFHLMERAKWSKSQSEAYEREVREIQRDITQELAEAQELAELQEQIKQTQEQKAELQEQKAELQEQKAELQEQKAELQEEKAQLEEKAEQLRLQLQQVQQEKNEMAVNLLRAGLSLDVIAQTIGLSIEDLEKLKK
jgi:predicted transposase/invertase (TIGR01784 family)